MSEALPTSSADPVPRAVQWDVLFGLIALGFAAVDAFLMTASTVVAHTRWQRSDFALAISWVIFDYGLALDVLAMLLALAAARAGRRGRRLALIAILLVATSFLLLFVG